MRAGELRDKIRIERAAKTSSRSGAARRAWVPLRECRANIRTAKVGAEVQSDQPRQVATHVIRIRHFAEVTFGCRIVPLSRPDAQQAYNVLSVSDPDGRRRDMVIEAVEVRLET